MSVEARALIGELRRRRVFRALVGYGIAAFAVLQIIEPVMHGLRWPEEVLSYVVVLLAAGFPVVLALAWIFDVKAGRIERTPGPARPWVLPALMGVGVLVALPGLVYYLWARAPRAAAAGSRAEATPSIAVLPLANLSRDPDQEYFADGLAEELLDLLAKAPGLRVVARTSAFSFKGKNQDVRAIGQSLGVSVLLEGSVQKSGDQVRITTQLIDAADGYHLWSETYDRKLTDVFAVQDDIARSVVAALKLKLLPAQLPTTANRRTADPEAYRRYLLGRQQMRLARREAFLLAAKEFEKALAIDPKFAPAWAGLASAHFWIADSAETPAEGAEGKRKADEAAAKAVALGPDLLEAYVARGLIRSTIHYDWQGANADFQRALALNPEDTDAIRGYITAVLRPLGRSEEAVAMARKAVESDPLNPGAWSMVGTSLLAIGKFDEAREAAERALEIAPQHAFATATLGLAYLMQGRPAEALPAFDRSNAIFRLAGRAMARHATGQSRESETALNELIAKYAHSGAYQIAEVYAWRGEKDAAFSWLERARDQHDAGLTLLKLDGLMRPLHGDPRYADLLRGLNLPPG